MRVGVESIAKSHKELAPTAEPLYGPGRDVVDTLVHDNETPMSVLWATVNAEIYEHPLCRINVCMEEVIRETQSFRTNEAKNPEFLILQDPQRPTTTHTAKTAECHTRFLSHKRAQSSVSGLEEWQVRSGHRGTLLEVLMPEQR